VLWLKYGILSSYGKCKFGISIICIYTFYRGPFTSEGKLESGVGAHIPGTLKDE